MAPSRAIIVLFVCGCAAGCTEPGLLPRDSLDPCVEAGHIVCGATSWAWNLTNQVQLGMDVTVDFGAQNSCNQTITWQALSRAPRPIMTAFEFRGDSVVAGAAFGGLRTVHSNSLPPVGAQERYPGGIGFEDRRLSGVMRTVAVGIDLDPEGGPDGEPSMSWRLHCVNGFNITRIAQSHDVQLWEAGYMDGDGVAVRSLSPFVWYTNQADGRLRLEGQAEGSVLFVASNYEELQTATGRISLDGPVDDLAWDINGEFATSFEGPAGTYELQVDYESMGSPDRLIGILGTFTIDHER